MKSACVDSDHAACPDSRISVSCKDVLLAGGVVSWFSRAEGNKTLRKSWMRLTLRSHTILIMKAKEGAIFDVGHYIVRDIRSEIKHAVILTKALGIQGK